MLTDHGIQTEELLIDFHELEGEHSGANMAEAVWDMLTQIGIEECVSHGQTKHRVDLNIIVRADHGVRDG
jgi:hypothetical protein